MSETTQMNDPQMSDQSQTQQAAFASALPDNPTADHADETSAMPKALSKELGDYAEGDYAVSTKTKEAPTMEDSDFNAVVQSGLAD